MSENIAKRVCTIVARVFEADLENVQPTTRLSLGEFGWKRFLRLSMELERAFDIVFGIDVPNAWTCVADVIEAVEKAIAAAAAERAA